MTFTAPFQGRVTISNDPNVTDGNGLVLIPGMSKQNYTLAADGDMVQKEFYAIYIAPLAPVGIVEQIE